MRSDLTSKLREKLRNAPLDPGCYLMKDSKGRVIYTGKAKSLRKRLLQYFKPLDLLDHKTKILSESIYDFEVIITTTEVEALLLERTLIKHHKPQFNILLRDDKEYPLIRCDFNEDWPRLEKVRRRLDDSATYVGPFAGPGQLNLLMDAVFKIFPLIRCSRHEFKTARKPCHYFHMKMCLAPCTKPVDRTIYQQMIEDTLSFLRGEKTNLITTIKKRMEDAAEREEFELAAIYRDQVQAFALVTEKQSVVTSDVKDADVIGMAHTETKISFHVLTVRDYHVIASDNFLTLSRTHSPHEAIMEFTLLYYDGRSLPPEILLPHDLGGDETDLVRLALLESHPDRNSLDIKKPLRGERADLVGMANRNAEHQLTDGYLDQTTASQELELVRDILKLHHVPNRAECIDISNTQGSAIVASLVCFIGGKPAKDQYRSYAIKTVTEGPDDFKSIAEVVERRLERGVREGDLPDLLIIDGGKGQLNAALDVTSKFHGLRLDVISLAKSRLKKQGKHEKRTFERVFRPDSESPIPLAPGTPAYRFMTQIRDEAHRFAITHHRKKRLKLSMASDLETIPGIGTILRRRLLETFGSLDGIAKATLPELKKVKGVTDRTAILIYSFFREKAD